MVDESENLKTWFARERGSSKLCPGFPKPYLFTLQSRFTHLSFSQGKIKRVRQRTWPQLSDLCFEDRQEGDSPYEMSVALTTRCLYLQVSEEQMLWHECVFQRLTTADWVPTVNSDKQSHFKGHDGEEWAKARDSEWGAHLPYNHRRLGWQNEIMVSLRNR